ncbi:hypothetical protein QQS21_005827 [Conoideocrella luteorostrata]|uniref:Protein kinase domain-containing protein n=1 Tax=Conoideocrella luteorostrata TaxID=1105319 RepID=A0AAJ0CT07_9HYPO|nr:hypothetical protein QQS21_005827 [Conoideocrella luteorostrata]
MLVAKIYDPLREAAAYEELGAAAVDGLLVPKYHGSWSFNLALPCSQGPRPVRMILMEWVSGSSLQSLINSQQQLKRFSPQQRLLILARAMEVECRVSFCGVRHGDFAPRDILLEDAEMNPRALLVDFDHSAVFSRRGCRYKRQNTTRPISPRYRYCGPCPNELLRWVPEPHRSRPACFKGWLKNQLEHSSEFAYRKEGNIKLLDYDEPVEIVQPHPDDGIVPSIESVVVDKFRHQSYLTTLL